METIRFNVPWVTGREQVYLDEVFRARAFYGMGPFTERCRRHMEAKFGSRRIMLTDSCTSALEISALLLKLKPGDEVIMPSFTFTTTASAFARTGAKIVFCEVDPQTMLVDLNDIARRITPRTRAIVPVHYAGQGVDVDALQALIGTRSITIVEDAAQGIDAQLDGRWLGTLAPLAAYSFHESKNIQCGLGGALLINDEQFIERAEYIIERGTNRQRFYKGLVDKYTWVEVGGSFYPTEMQAAFLLAQLESLDENTSRRRQAWERYDAALRPLADAGRFALPPHDARMRINYHAFFLLMPTIARADALRLALNAEGIQAVIHYVPLHSSPVGESMGYAADDLPVTEDAARRLLRLPMHADLGESQVERVIEAVERLTR